MPKMTVFLSKCKVFYKIEQINHDPIILIDPS